MKGWGRLTAKIVMLIQLHVNSCVHSNLTLSSDAVASKQVNCLQLIQMFVNGSVS